MPLGITIVRSLYWKIKAILADSAQIPPNFRIRMKIPYRRRMHPSIVQVDPTPPGHPAEAREFVRVPATSCGRCRASLGGPAGFSSPAAAAASSRPDTQPWLRAAAAGPARPRRRDYGDAPTVPDGAVVQVGGRPAQDCMSRWCSWDEKRQLTPSSTMRGCISS